jgi:uncharacterized protein
MLRFVIGPSAELIPDVAANLPGRGLWITPCRDVLEHAVAKGLFARAARRPLALPAGLGDRVEILLARCCCDLIGLARRSGLAVAGFDKVREAIRGGRAGVLLSAIDGADDGRGKIQALGRDLPIAAVLTGVEMGAVFGRDRVVHVALGSGSLGRRLIRDAEKLAGFRSGATVDQPVETARAALARPDGSVGAR